MSGAPLRSSDPPPGTAPLSGLVPLPSNNDPAGEFPSPAAVAPGSPFPRREAGEWDPLRGGGVRSTPPQSSSPAPAADLASREQIAPPESTIAPYFADELVTIYQADSIDLSFLAADSVQLVVTSPPYNLGKDYGTTRDDATYQSYLAWVGRWSGELLRVLEPGGRLCLNIPIDINLKFDEHGRRSTGKQPVLTDFTQLLVRELGYVYNTTILWLEGNVSRRTAWGSWLKASDPWVNLAAEAVLVLSKGQRKRSARGKTSDINREDFMDWTLGIWKFNGQQTSAHGHPAPFPEELPRRLIHLFSFREDTVLDPFLGSGTTCRVAKNLGRRSIGVEIEARYCEIAARRCRE